MKQLSAKEWIKGHYDHGMVLPYSWHQLEGILGFVFEDCEEDGIGPTKIARALLASGKQVSFECVLLGKVNETIVYTLFDPAPDYDALSEVLFEIGLVSDGVIWESPLVENRLFRLSRLDDNNNEFVVGNYHWESDAKLKMQQLTSHPHKQHYWIDRIK